MPKGRVNIKPKPVYSDRCLARFSLVGYGGPEPIVYGAYVAPECKRMLIYDDGYLGTIEKHKTVWRAYPALTSGLGTRQQPLTKSGYESRADAWQALLDHACTTATGRNSLRATAQHLWALRAGTAKVAA